jgi:large subunit ribosomal protein L6
MSRIGKKSIPVPKGVTASVKGQTVTAKGPRGELAFLVPEILAVEMGAEGVTVTPRDDSKTARSAWGMSRTQVANLVTGVSTGFERKLEINGVGYRAAVQGEKLNLTLGFSHEVAYAIPKGIKIVTPKPTEIVISGADRQLVGEVAAQIRKYRPPEPYKGKGIKYAGEHIVRKEGKKK